MKRNAWFLVLMTLCLALLTAGTACGSDEGSTQSDGSTAVAADAPLVAQADPGAALALVQTQCSRCHTLERICTNLGVKSKDEWQVTVERMLGKGAALSPEEAAQAIDALTDLEAGNPAICR